MKRQEFIEILQEQFPKEASWAEDFIGLQIEGKEEIKTVMVTLDLTHDVIYQAIEKKIDMIISHHPFYFGEKQEILSKNYLKKAQYDLLKKLNINVLIIHTNADFNPNSIAFYQANAINLENIRQLNLNQGVIGNVKEEIDFDDFVKFLRDSLELNYDFRTNVSPNVIIKNVIFGSGASGDIIDLQNNEDSLYIIGEMKHHQWIMANEKEIKILEIGHFSEFIFKIMIKIYLEQETDLKVIFSKEKNGYKTI